MKEKIYNRFLSIVEDYQKEHGIEGMWRTPLMCFTDANSDYIKNIRKNVNSDHILPKEFLPDASIVIAFFLPFSKDIIDSNKNKNDNTASKEWADSYGITNKAMAEFNMGLAEIVENLGYKAVIPTGINMNREKLMSPWSHRHMAYAGGMGTFGINNMLITKSGCSGRYMSLVTNLPVEPDKMLEEEYCLYKRNGTCKACVKNCFSGALTTEGFDRVVCLEACNKNEELFGEGVCGKCSVGVPCALSAPSI